MLPRLPLKWLDPSAIYELLIAISYQLESFNVCPRLRDILGARQERLRSTG